MNGRYKSYLKVTGTFFVGAICGGAVMFYCLGRFMASAMYSSLIATAMTYLSSLEALDKGDLRSVVQFQPTSFDNSLLSLSADSDRRSERQRIQVLKLRPRKLKVDTDVNRNDTKSESRLQNDYRPLAAAGRRRPKQATVPNLAAPVAADEDDATLLLQVIDYYHAALRQSSGALAYLERRGIASSEVFDTFKLGFANRTLGYRLPRMNRKDGAAVRGQLQRP